MGHFVAVAAARGARRSLACIATLQWLSSLICGKSHAEDMQEAFPFAGEVLVGESYFGGSRNGFNFWAVEAWRSGLYGIDPQFPQRHFASVRGADDSPWQHCLRRWVHELRCPCCF